jgi:hypothetical protein
MNAVALRQSPDREILPIAVTPDQLEQFHLTTGTGPDVSHRSRWQILPRAIDGPLVGARLHKQRAHLTQIVIDVKAD